MITRFVNEMFSFERSSSDPLKNLSVGKRVQIIKWLDSFNVKNYTINDDFTIDVKGDVELDHKSLTCFPSFIKFNKVSGYFDCATNQLTSLEGCPTIVDGNFLCYNNQLTNLQGCPTTVCGSFYCHNNQLISLEGCPTIVNGDFYCYNNQLTSLEGCPATIGGSFSCHSNNKQFSEEYVKSLCKVKRNIDV